MNKEHQERSAGKGLPGSNLPVLVYANTRSQPVSCRVSKRYMPYQPVGLPA